MKSDTKLIIILSILIMILLIGFAFRIYMVNEKNKNMDYSDNYTSKSSVNVTKNQVPYEQKIMNFLIIIFVVAGITIVIQSISMWRIFKDNGIPGWQSIIPILNCYRMYEMVEIPSYLAFVIIVPYVGQMVRGICNIIFTYKLAQLYNKGIGFTIGLIILPCVFYPILAFKK